MSKEKKEKKKPARLVDKIINNKRKKNYDHCKILTYTITASILPVMVEQYYRAIFQLLEIYIYIYIYEGLFSKTKFD